jgi:phospholipase/carboxylesterase
VPLVVLFHGATSNPLQVLPIMRAQAESHGFMLLIPKSQERTWDVIMGGFGPDVEALDTALAYVYDHFDVDPVRRVLAGFSDGASYALSLGLVNGEMFGQLFALSAGYVIPGPRQGRPRIFMSHGWNDRVLPIDRCGRRVMSRLRGEGYAVDYREFDGGHEVPPEAVEVALAWLFPPEGD